MRRTSPVRARVAVPTASPNSFRWWLSASEMAFLASVVARTTASEASLTARSVTSAALLVASAALAPTSFNISSTARASTVCPVAARARAPITTASVANADKSAFATTSGSVTTSPRTPRVHRAASRATCSSTMVSRSIVTACFSTSRRTLPCSMNRPPRCQRSPPRRPEDDDGRSRGNLSIKLTDKPAYQ